MIIKQGTCKSGRFFNRRGFSSKGRYGHWNVLYAALVLTERITSKTKAREMLDEVQKQKRRMKKLM